MIYVGGIHGAGKTYFCRKVQDATGINFFTASSLIRERRSHDFPASKYAAEMETDRICLLNAVEELKKSHEEFLLDGHFCLLNEKGEVTRLPVDTFVRLNPASIILITEDPVIIAKRLKERDYVVRSTLELQAFQKEELGYAEEAAKILRCPFTVYKGSREVLGAIEYLSHKFSSNVSVKL